MRKSDSLINQSVHQRNGVSSDNITNNLNFHSISAGSPYSPTALHLYLIYKQILPCTCVIWGPNNNTQGVSSIISLSKAALAQRHRMSPTMLRATIKVMFYIYSYCDLHSDNTTLYFSHWTTGDSTIFWNTGTDLTCNNTVSWPRTLTFELPCTAIEGQTPNTWVETVHIPGWGNLTATWKRLHLLFIQKQNMDAAALVTNTYSSHLHDSKNIARTHGKSQLNIIGVTIS